MFQCEGTDGKHQLAMIQWFDWVRRDNLLECDVYQLMDENGLQVISLASIRRKVVMMPAPGPNGEFYRNAFVDMYLHQHR